MLHNNRFLSTEPANSNQKADTLVFDQSVHFLLQKILRYLYKYTFLLRYYIWIPKSLFAYNCLMEVIVTYLYFPALLQ